MIAEGVKRFNHQIHGYCWMANHVHTVVEVADVPLWASKIRSLVALLYAELSGPISRVAEYFDKDLSTLSKNLSKLKQKLLVDDCLQQEVEA